MPKIIVSVGKRLDKRHCFCSLVFVNRRIQGHTWRNVVIKKITWLVSWNGCGVECPSRKLRLKVIFSQNTHIASPPGTQALTQTHIPTTLQWLWKFPKIEISPHPAVIHFSPNTLLKRHSKTPTNTEDLHSFPTTIPNTFFHSHSNYLTTT